MCPAGVRRAVMLAARVTAAETSLASRCRLGVLRRVSSVTVYGDCHGDASTIDEVTVDRLDGSLGVLGGRHLDESEATGSAAVVIGDDFGVDDRAVLGEDHPEIVCGGMAAEIADVKIAGDRFLV